MLDFTGGLARLLRDGHLRERFARDPVDALGEWSIGDGDRAALIGLDPEELEVQAGVLLHKRFEEVQRVLSATCTNLGDSAWPLFRKYARYYWPDGEADRWADADAFGAHLEGERADALDPAERNRARFAVGRRRFGVAFVRRMAGGAHFRPAIQFFWRPRQRSWREVAVFPGL